MKKLLLLITLISLTPCAHGKSWSVNVTPQKNIQLDDAFKANKSGWDFELRNKDKSSPIYVTLKQNDITFLNDEKIGAPTGSKEKDFKVIRLVGLDLTRNSTIKISYKPGQQNVPDFSYKIIGTQKAKTIYISFEKGALRAQSGSLGKTQSGLSLKNNVGKNELKAE